MRTAFQNITGYLYFIQIEHMGPIKIGFSKNIKRRMTHLQTAMPYDLNLIYFSPSAVCDEEEYHRALRGDNMRGEWFWPTKKVLRSIEARRKIDARNGWVVELSDPQRDFRDERWSSDYWKEKTNAT
jgi:hypothetical protein